MKNMNSKKQNQLLNLGFTLSISLLYLMTFTHAAIGKIQSPTTPEWFIKSFQSTFLSSMPGGLGLQFGIITYAELLLSLVFLAAIILLVVKNEIGQLLFNLGLLGSVLMFTSLSFGQRLVFNFDSSAQLFFYAAFSYILFVSNRVLQNSQSPVALEK